MEARASPRSRWWTKAESGPVSRRKSLHFLKKMTSFNLSTKLAVFTPSVLLKRARQLGPSTRLARFSWFLQTRSTVLSAYPNRVSG